MKQTLIFLTFAFVFTLLPKAEAQFETYQRYQANYTPLSENPTLEEAVDWMTMLYQTSDDGEGLHQKFTAKGANCNAFIRPNGSYGPYGQYISQAFNDYDHLQNLLEDDAGSARGMNYLCPNFEKFDHDTRVKFWVWAFASIAWDESTCKPGARAKGSTTTAVGLLQMEAPWKTRKWRGGLCSAFRDVSSPRANLLCGMEIMSAHFDAEYQVKKKGCTGERARGLVLSCSYWQKLRNIDSMVARLISLFPECRARGMSRT